MSLVKIVRNAVHVHWEPSQKAQLMRYCKVAKLAASVAALVSVGQMLWFNTPPSVVVGIGGLAAAHDVYVMAENFETVADNLFKGIAATISKGYVVQQLSKKTILPVWPSVIRYVAKRASAKNAWRFRPEA